MKLSLREYIFNIEKAHKKRRQVDPYQQKYHVMPPVGGIYEPSGLCDCDGDYYVFIQYSPMDIDRNGQCFSLYKSRDLLHFMYVGVPIIADQNIDKDGVFSGSTLMIGKEMYFYYTGKVIQQAESNELERYEFNTIVVKVSKDSYFNDVYSDKLVVLKSTDYNEIASGRVSGPKVWQENEAHFMVHAVRLINGCGMILFFTSKDKIKWEYKKKLYVKEEFDIFECPDFFYLDNKPILSINMLNDPSQDQSMDSFRNDVKSNVEYITRVNKTSDDYKVGYYFIEGKSIDDYVLGEFHEWDKGFDFYAPQTFMDRNERVIMIALMGIPNDLYINPTKELGWQHCLTIPRELVLKEGKLFQSPIKEFEMLRKNGQSETIKEELEVILKNTSEIILSYAKESRECNVDINNILKLIYDRKKQKFSMKFVGGMGYGRSKREIRLKNLDEMRILLDSSSIEIFLNGGEEVLTTRIFKREKEYVVKVRSNSASLKWWDIEI